MSRRQYEAALEDLEEAELLGAGATRLTTRGAKAGAPNHPGRHREALGVLEELIPQMVATHGQRSWSTASALRELSRALEGIASETGRDSDRRRARAAFRRYRRLLDDLEANPEGVPGYSVTI
jgi:hypothetical protein